VGFDEGIAETVDWFRQNEAWWRAIRSGDWDAYYARQYGARLAGGVAAAEAPTASRAGTSVATAPDPAALDHADEPPPELG
jgi:hypothetical protein